MTTDPSLTDRTATGGAGAPNAPEAAARADEAARSVIPTYGRSLLGLPGTHLAMRCFPAPPWQDPTWNYWWQAHYLDAIVDAGLRHVRAGDEPGARGYLDLGRRLLRTVWLRNLGRFTNDFYDDMGWLILAADRLTLLDDELRVPPIRLVRQVVRRIAPQLLSAATDELGGGLYWTTKRDRKNVPATAPAAIRFALTGEVERAKALVEWIYGALFDETSGLALDTVYTDGRRDDSVYSYNQGILLGALLAIGDEASLARATALIEAVDRGLRVGSAADGRPVLRTYGDGDGGLFTGILVRYLGAAAADDRLPEATRRAAGELVLGTADALWAGSERRHLLRVARVFSSEPPRSAADTLAPGSMLELTPQLQAWTILEAAATLRG